VDELPPPLSSNWARIRLMLSARSASMSRRAQVSTPLRTRRTTARRSGASRV